MQKTSDSTGQEFSLVILDFDDSAFWSQVDIRSENQCWLWRGNVRSGSKMSSDGEECGYDYGFFVFDGRSMAAHRFAYLSEFGGFDEAFLVCHRCDNPLCVNPRHLFLGDQRANKIDADIKGRSNVSGGKSRSYLDRRDVSVIRALLRMGYSTTDVARKFLKGSSHISSIRTEKSWPGISACDASLVPEKFQDKQQRIPW